MARTAIAFLSENTLAGRLQVGWHVVYPLDLTLKIFMSGRMSDPASSSRLVVYVTVLHGAVMMSIAFWCLLLVLGGPFGLTPALAALLAEARQWRRGAIAHPGVFARMWRDARQKWTTALPASIPVLASAGLFVVARSASPPMAAISAVAAVWLILGVHHIAWLMSLDQNARAGGWRFFVLSAWLHLGGLLLWALTWFGLVLPALPLVMFFTPAAIALILIFIEAPALRILPRLHKAEPEV